MACVISYSTVVQTKANVRLHKSQRVNRKHSPHPFCAMPSRRQIDFRSPFRQRRCAERNQWHVGAESSCWVCKLVAYVSRCYARYIVYVLYVNVPIISTSARNHTAITNTVFAVNGEACSAAINHSTPAPLRTASTWMELRRTTSSTFMSKNARADSRNSFDTGAFNECKWIEYEKKDDEEIANIKQNRCMTMLSVSLNRFDSIDVELKWSRLIHLLEFILDLNFILNPKLMKFSKLLLLEYTV